MAGKARINNAEVEAANEIYKVAREQADIEIAELKEKQMLIAQTHEIIGRIQGVQMLVKFGDVASLMWLKQVKETKIYRDLPHVGTWEDFCNYIGKSRRHIDEDLLNLQVFGEEFLGYVSSLSVGYRELKKLRQLTHDGAIQITDDAIEISGERIPLDAEHKEDLQAAIEKVVEEQAALKDELKAQQKAHDRVQEDTRKSMVKLQKENDQYLKKAQARGLTLDEDAFIAQISGYRDLAQGALIVLDPNAEDNIIPGDLTIRMKTALISAALNLKMQTLALYDTVVTQIGDPTINPDVLEDYSRWEEANGFKDAG